MRFFNFFLVLLLSSLIIDFSYADIDIMGSDIELKSDELIISSYLANTESKVKSGIVYEYEIRRSDDLALVYSTNKELIFDSNEVLLINDSIDISDFVQGEYYIYLNVKSSSGAPISFLNEKFKVENSEKFEIYFEKKPYLKIYYDYSENIERYEHSFADTGKPIFPGSEFDLLFSLRNDGLEDGCVDIDFVLNETYFGDNDGLIYTDSIVIEQDSIVNQSIDLNLTEPGTYNLFVELRDCETEKLRAKAPVRVVIIGGDGNIMNVLNKKDVYSPNENFEFDVSIIGPADGISIVEDGFLELTLEKNGEEVFTQREIVVNFPFTPQNYLFEGNVSEELDYYRARVILGKDDKIYDEIILDYEPLEAELLLSPDGRIYDNTKIMCFDDDICSESEKTIGNCADCDNRLIEEEDGEEPIEDDLSSDRINKDDNKSGIGRLVIIFSLVIVFIVAFTTISVYLSRRFKNEN